MKIDASTIFMNSSRSYHKVSSNTRISTGPYLSEKDAEKKAGNKNGNALSQDMKDKLNDLEKENEQLQAKTLSGGGELKFERADSPEDVKLRVLKRILEMLNDRKDGSKSFFDIAATKLKSTPDGLKAAGGGAKPSVWKRQTIVSSFMAETENTSFSTMGTVRTADGREINFNLELEMSRSYMEHFTYMKEETAVFTDPLVINLDTNVASISDQKFLFDIDNDGKEEEISYLNKGSGYLALDKNGDGKINDGSELFGTESGDGFRDLAAYDKDRNGWIDENDEIFDKLKIWTKDEDGTDRLISLKEAGVGAIYLGNVSTEFALKGQENNNTNGVIRSTGLYLKESGEAGTMQHIDLAV